MQTTSTRCLPESNTVNQFHCRSRLTTAKYFIIEEAKENVLDFAQGTVRTL